MAVYRHRAQLINQGNSKYPHVNWIDEAIGEDNSFNRSLIDTARMKIEMKFYFAERKILGGIFKIFRVNRNQYVLRVKLILPFKRNINVKFEDTYAWFLQTVI